MGGRRCGGCIFRWLSCTKRRPNILQAKEAAKRMRCILLSAVFEWCFFKLLKGDDVMRAKYGELIFTGDQSREAAIIASIALRRHSIRFVGYGACS